MSKKKKGQFIAIGFLILAIPLLIPNTDWSNSTSIYGFISLIFGTSGSIISIFIPSNYTHFFYMRNWGKDNDGGYQLLIPSKKHGLGKASHVQVFQGNNNLFDEVVTSIQHDKKGNIIINANSKFEGKVIITS